MQTFVIKNQHTEKRLALWGRWLKHPRARLVQILDRMSSDQALRDMTEAQRRDAGIDEGTMDHIEARSRPLIR